MTVLHFQLKRGEFLFDEVTFELSIFTISDEIKPSKLRHRIIVNGKVFADPCIKRALALSGEETIGCFTNCQKVG